MQTQKEKVFHFVLEGIIVIFNFLYVLIDTFELIFMHLLPFPIETWRYVYIGVCIPLVLGMVLFYILAIRWEVRNSEK